MRVQSPTSREWCPKPNIRLSEGPQTPLVQNSQQQPLSHLKFIADARVASRCRFYLPHGITIDGDNNYWLTDVALHQVFKFEEGGTEPLLTLGKRFEPGTNDDRDRFCKPTDVAVASNGDIFVADG